jgi:hypothetical protein
LNDFIIYFRDKPQLHKNFNVANDLMETFLGTLAALEILQLRKTMNQFVHN